MGRRKETAARRFHLNRVKRYKDQIRHGQCCCCSNPRRNGWYGSWSGKSTLQELRAYLEEDDWNAYYDELDYGDCE